MSRWQNFVHLLFTQEYKFWDNCCYLQLSYSFLERLLFAEHSSGYPIDEKCWCQEFILRQGKFFEDNFWWDVFLWLNLYIFSKNTTTIINLPFLAAKTDVCMCWQFTSEYYICVCNSLPPTLPPLVTLCQSLKIFRIW